MIPNHAWLNPSKSQLTFTQEQQDILDSTEPAILVNAVAGSGKTSVLMEMAKKYNLKVIEDAAHALPSKYKNIRIGLTICYDLRFPELYSGLARQCDVIVNIANWPKKRVEHWNTLLKARAIEGQLFVIGVNRTGKDGKNVCLHT